MSLQPGEGYNFSASSSGFNLDIHKPWTPPMGDGVYLGVQFPTPPPRIPEQLVNSPMPSIRPAPFQCRIVSVNGERFLQIASGSIAYSGTNMPVIYDGAFTQLGQAEATKVQICPSGMREEGDIYPGGDPGIDPYYSDLWWMEEGGGYKLSDTLDPIAIYAFKWDVQPGVEPFNENSIIETGLPTLAIIAESNTADSDKIEKGTGPSIYENTMNVEKMEGYAAADTDLPGDWGNCHTTWFNPRRFGYNYKLIAQVNAASNPAFTASVSIVQPAVTGLSNMIQKITFDGNPSGGSVTITCGGFTSIVSFPVTNFYDATTPIYSNELTLKACLESITSVVLPGVELPVSFAGNVEVSKYSDSAYYVTFVNKLQGMTIPLMSIDTSAVTSYSYDMNITQYHTGTLDLTIPLQFGMTQLMNKKGITEAVDPYNLNKDGTPKWKDINNREDVINCKDFSGDVTSAGMQNLNAMTSVKPDYTKVGGCSPTEDTCDHPFEFHPFTVGDGGEGFLFRANVCAGMVNNLVPLDEVGSTTKLPATIDFLVNEDTYIYLRLGTEGYASSTPVFPVTDDTDAYYPTIVQSQTVLTDTDEYCYILMGVARNIGDAENFTIDQTISGSVWAERLKVGTRDALYYWAGV